MDFFHKKARQLIEKLRSQGEEERARKLEYYLAEIDKALGED